MTAVSEGLVGIDLGGTGVKAVWLVEGRVVRQVTAPTPRGSPSEALDVLARLARELRAPLRRVGLAIPGEVDESGRCVRLPNLPGFEGLHLAGELGGRLGCAVAVENDGTAAALAELRHGHGSRFESFVLITLGTGVGGGLVLGRELWRGAHGFAGEVGHVRIERGAGAARCGCGRRGCVEARAGTRALLERAAALGEPAADLEALFRRAAEGSRVAVQIIEELGETIGLLLTSIQNVLDLEAAVFSGGPSRSFALLEPALRRTLRVEAFSPVLAELPLLVSALGPDAPAVGAALLAERLTPR